MSVEEQIKELISNEYLDLPYLPDDVKKMDEIMPSCRIAHDGTARTRQEMIEERDKLIQEICPDYVAKATEWINECKVVVRINDAVLERLYVLCQSYANEIGCSPSGAIKTLLIQGIVFPSRRNRPVCFDEDFSIGLHNCSGLSCPRFLRRELLLGIPKFIRDYKYVEEVQRLTALLNH